MEEGIKGLDEFSQLHPRINLPCLPDLTSEEFMKAFNSHRLLLCPTCLEWKNDTRFCVQLSCYLGGGGGGQISVTASYNIRWFDEQIHSFIHSWSQSQMWKGGQELRPEPNGRFAYDLGALTTASPVHPTANLGAEVVHGNCLLWVQRSRLLYFCLHQSLFRAAQEDCDFGRGCSLQRR